MTASAGTTTATRARADSGNHTVEAAPGELLDLLDDEYVREILLELVTEPKSAPDIAAACDCSRPTVYRRLKRLAAVGLVSTSLSVDADGHHRKLFHGRFDSLTVELETDGWSVTVESP